MGRADCDAKLVYSAAQPTSTGTLCQLQTASLHLIICVILFVLLFILYHRVICDLSLLYEHDMSTLHQSRLTILYILYVQFIHSFYYYCRVGYTKIHNCIILYTIDHNLMYVMT